MKQPSKESNPFLNLINCPSLTLPQGKGNFFLISFLLLLSSTNIFSQDTIKTSVKAVPPSAEKKKTSFHSPKKAAIFSVVIPGLGQAYNKKYWKIPIVYAAMGSTIYMFEYNNTRFKAYKKAYVDRDTANAFNYYFPKINDTHTYDLSQLQIQASYFRRFRDLSVILTGLAYTLNIVDAYVDAQLINFDISDDLSMSVFPSINLSAQRKNPSLGLTLSVRF